MFNVDPSKFYSAQQSLIDATDLISENKGLLSEITSYPSGYEYSSEVNSICSDINSISSDINNLVTKVDETKNQLINLDRGFALVYYESTLKDYENITEPLTPVEENDLKYVQEQYYEQLYLFLDDLKKNR